MGFLSGFSKVGFVENYGFRCTELFPNKNHCFPFDFNPFKAYAFLLQPHFLEVDDKSSEVKIMVIKKSHGEGYSLLLEARNTTIADTRKSNFTS